MPEVCLQNVCAPRGESRGAIGEVIAPHSPETLVEAHAVDLVGDAVEAIEPGLEGPRIVQSETVEFGDLQACLPTLLAQT